MKLLLHLLTSLHGTSRTSGDVRLESETRCKADIAQAPLTGGACADAAQTKVCSLWFAANFS